MSAIIISVACAVPAAAAEANLQKMEYDVYAGGFHVVEAHLNTDLTKPGRYDLELGARTRGFLGRLAPWHGVFKTNGWRDDKTGALRPELHQSVTTWRNDEETETYKYGRDGSFREYSVKDKNDPGAPRPVAAELTQGTTDALSVTFDVMQAVAANGKCEGSDDVFDGKRRYTLIFKEVRRVTLEKTKYNVYAGPAVECTVEVKPGAGKWREKPRGWMSIQEQGRARGTMPTVWLASLHVGGPAVPVKIMVKTEYGALFMHLTVYDNGAETRSVPQGG